MTTKAGGAYGGDGANTFTIDVDTVASGTNSSITVSGSTITVTLEEGQSIAASLADLNASADFTVASTGSTSVTSSHGSTSAGTITGGSDAVTTTGQIQVTAATAGDDFNGTITFAEQDGLATPTAAWSGGVLTVTVEDSNSVTIESIRQAIDDLAEFNATRSGALTTYDGDNAEWANATDTNLTNGTDEVKAGVKKDVTFELSGANGSEVFNISEGTSMAQLIAQINLVKDATGVEASNTGATLELRSTTYGSDAKVDLRVISEASGGSFVNGGRDTGSDVVATVNGTEASGKGNRLSINTATLDLTIDLVAGQTGDAAFTINGGGGLFQLGPDVVSNQQARLGIGSVSTGRLGGASGKLFQLGSGGSAALKTDATTAASIVDEAINQVTSLRGRLGAFQRTTLDSNMNSLTDTVANLMDAQSSIRDADFAQESANLTRAQILVQSGTQVLSLANQNPQSVLSLLR